MKVKFDDGERSTTLPEAFLSEYPEVGHLIEWEISPETDDGLALGRYRVEGVVWLLGTDTAPLITVHLVRL